MTSGENGVAVLFLLSVGYVLIMVHVKTQHFLMKFVKTNRAIF